METKQTILHNVKNKLSFMLGSLKKILRCSVLHERRNDSEKNELKNYQIKNDFKSIEQWLNELPEPFRTQSLFNKKHYAVSNTGLKYTLHSALLEAFAWGKTPEGFDYWRELFRQLVFIYNNEQKEIDLKNLKTYRELIEQLNEPERSQALQNIQEDEYRRNANLFLDMTATIEDQKEFLMSCFIFQNTPQGHKYWMNIFEQILNNTYNYATKEK